ncbi:MAG: hypothetical protein KBD05_02745 [Candidatus Pacebacteria bacterium]|nr:hypothetical protein [Candidatus Paceibacterota bacterium]
MKRPSFQKHSFERVSLISPNVRSLGFIVLAIVLVLGVLRLVFPGVLTAIATPLWGVGASFSQGVGDFTSSFGNARALTEERDRLIEEKAAMSLELATLRAEIADLGNVVGEGNEEMLVGVLAGPPVAPYDVLILAAGATDGVRTGLFVYGYHGVPIGTIREVGETSSRAVLFSEAGRENRGWAGENRIPVVLTGTGAGTFSMTASKDSGLAVGDVVYLPGPGAIPVGLIRKVETDPSSPDARVQIFPYANPFSLPYVRVGPASL